MLSFSHLAAALALLSLSPLALAEPARGHNPRRMLCLVNRERVRHRLPALGYNSALGRTATDHSRDQAAHRRMTHDSSTGLSLGTRCQQQGYKDWRTVGENVAYGYNGDEACLAAWLESPGHRENIMNPKFTHFGYGVAYTGDTPYYTQDFGGDGRTYDFPVCPDEDVEGDVEHRGPRGPGGHPGRRPPVYHAPIESGGDDHIDVIDTPKYGAERPDYSGDVDGYESSEDEFCDADYDDAPHDGPYEGGSDVIGEHHDAPIYPGGSGHGRPSHPGGDYPEAGGSHHGRPGGEYPGAGGSHHGRPGYPDEEYPGAGGSHHGRPGGEYPEGDGSHIGRRPSYPGAGGSHHGRPGGEYPEGPGHGGDFPGGEYPEGDGSHRGRRPSHPDGEYPEGPGHGGHYPGGEYPEGDGSHRGRRPHRPDGEYPEGPGHGGRRPHRPAYGGGEHGDHVDVPAYPDGDHVDVVKPAYGAPADHDGEHVDIVKPIRPIRPVRPAYGAPADHDGEHVDIVKPAYGAPAVDHVDVVKPAYGAPADHVDIVRPGRPTMMPRGRHAPAHPILEGDEEEHLAVEAAAPHVDDQVDPAVFEAAALHAQPAVEAAPLEAAPIEAAAPVEAAAPQEAGKLPTGDEPALDIAPTDQEEA